MGKLHAANIVKYVPEIKLKYLITPRITEGVISFCRELGIQNFSYDPSIPFTDPNLDCIIIASPTSTHSDLIQRACISGKAVFCEKPIGLNIVDTLQTVKSVNESKIPFMVGFVRRFRFYNVYERVNRGEIGTPEMLFINSRDPKPFTEKYIKNSGGMFHDMTIHDFDMIQFLSDSFIDEIYVNSACLVDPFFKKYNDVDSSVISVKLKNKSIGVITNSRRGWYYDQRVEVLGSKGVVQACANLNTNITIKSLYKNADDITTDGFDSENNNAFLYEMQAFARMLKAKTPSPVNVEAGFRAAVASYAAEISFQENRPVKTDEVLEKLKSCRFSKESLKLF
jgi:myo-inositol 2-dehydrogenase/D-chiro-inositol 1-dehydrogenase